MQLFVSLLSGLIFGLGLILSGMTNPAKVQAFLDLAGPWDPSLAFVMAGAIAVATVAFRWAKGRARSLTGDPIRIPAASRIDRRLVLGSLAFGAGWGLTGYCPGPAITSATLGSKPLVFVVAMVAGMAVYEILNRLGARRHPESASSRRSTKDQP